MQDLDILRDIEPWEGYYMVRSEEIKNLLKFARLARLGDVLDIGCGNAFTSYLLSSRADNVVAADLYSKNAESHSPGIHSAKELLSRMQAGDIKLYSCSVEEMPFPDERFDVVYSGYLLQYLGNRKRAFDEMKRVLKKGGVLLVVVPNFIERIWAFLQFYVYMAVKVLGLVFERKKSEQASGRGLSERMAGFRDTYRFFPFPGPHGAYRNSAAELVKHLPFSWNREFKENGFKVIRTFTTTFVPYPLALTVSLKIARTLSVMFGGLTALLGDKPLVKYLGYNYCAVLKK